MPVSRLPSGFALVIAVALCIAASPSVSLAASRAQSTGAGNNCVNRIEHLSPGSPEAQIVSRTCFATFAGAIRHATRGTTLLPSNARPEYLTQKMLSSGLSPDSVDATYVLGIDWDTYNYLGSSQVWEAGTGCDFSHWYTLSYVGNGWNDQTASAKGYSGCVHYRHFEHINYGGLVRTCNPNCQGMGTMEYLTSSEQFDD